MISERLDKLVEEMRPKASCSPTQCRSSKSASSPACSARATVSLTRTAETLGIHRNTLTRKMGEYKIKRRA